MNTTHIETTPGVGYTIYCKPGSDPLTVRSYHANGEPRLDYLVQAEESAYVPNAYNIITLMSDGDCAWRITPLCLVGSSVEGTGEMGIKGEKGDPGKSAYELAVANGYSGTVAEWLAALKGEPGVNGKSAYELAVANGYSGTVTEWLDSLHGADGDGAAILIDEEPRANSRNAVSSGGVYEALQQVAQQAAVEVDGSYSATSPNPQSGTAVAAAIAAHAGEEGLHLTEEDRQRLERDITVDTVVTEGSGNAVSSGAVHEALKFCPPGGSAVAIGLNSTAEGANAAAAGLQASAGGWGATAFGCHSEASAETSAAFGHATRALGKQGIAMGWGAHAGADASTAIGYNARNYDKGTTLIQNTISMPSGTRIRTRFFIIAANSPMSYECCGGHAGLGYIEEETTTGTLVARGTIRLSELLTERAEFFNPQPEPSATAES